MNIIILGHSFSQGQFASILVVFVLWSLLWKGLALWRAARRNSKAWFVVLILINTLGILEIIYLLATNSPKSNTVQAGQ